MTLTRIDPPLPLETNKGKAMAHFLTWDHELPSEFGCFLNSSGEFWWIKQTEIKLEENWTAGTNKQPPYAVSQPPAV